ncbi:hypothetical protein CYLTODRAFT_423191 [Cylindrobasidium torrendii FP15055 ss-10]|uniref:Uncharacterized protein n=1 Tax=Cylindrobasidium torrendii FP15055 ss-10 TaxID=1314674 RepID=A0A0D7BB36_9AGAR|nr:hypothetical protein CYLTODRAFT_423191 [Cylindrobasidium torrendii FP15055 ss-10]
MPSAPLSPTRTNFVVSRYLLVKVPFRLVLAAAGGLGRPVGFHPADDPTHGQAPRRTKTPVADSTLLLLELVQESQEFIQGDVASVLYSHSRSTHTSPLPRL